MVQKALAILLAVSWIVLTKVDMSEDLNFESRDTPSASSSPSTAKPVKLPSDHVELASRASDPRIWKAVPVHNSLDGPWGTGPYEVTRTTAFFSFKSSRSCPRNSAFFLSISL